MFGGEEQLAAGSRVVADDVRDGCAALGGEAVELVAEDDLVLVQHAIDDRYVPG